MSYVIVNIWIAKKELTGLECVKTPGEPPIKFTKAPIRKNFQTEKTIHPGKLKYSLFKISGSFVILKDMY
jgi:hypothetical protein